MMAQVLCSANGGTNTHTALTSLGSCDIPAAALKPGDRIEVRFIFAHTGTASGFDVQVKWGNTTVLARHGGRAGYGGGRSGGSGHRRQRRAGYGAKLGHGSAFLPGIVSGGQQSAVKVDLLGAISGVGADSIGLTSYTVLRYPGI